MVEGSEVGVHSLPSCSFCSAQVHLSGLPVHPLLVALHLLCRSDNNGEHWAAARLGKNLLSKSANTLESLLESCWSPLGTKKPELQSPCV